MTSASWLAPTSKPLLRARKLDRALVRPASNPAAAPDARRDRPRRARRAAGRRASARPAVGDYRAAVVRAKRCCVRPRWPRRLPAASWRRSSTRSTCSTVVRRRLRHRTSTTCSGFAGTATSAGGCPRAAGPFERALERALKAATLVLQAGLFGSGRARSRRGAARRCAAAAVHHLAPPPARCSRAGGRRAWFSRPAPSRAAPAGVRLQLSRVASAGTRWGGQAGASRLLLGLDAEVRIVRARDAGADACRVRLRG